MLEALSFILIELHCLVVLSQLLAHCIQVLQKVILINLESCNLFPQLMVLVQDFTWSCSWHEPLLEIVLLEA